MEDGKVDKYDRLLKFAEKARSDQYSWSYDILALLSEFKGLASRVEELERLLRNGLECQQEGCISWQAQVKAVLEDALPQQNSSGSSSIIEAGK